MAKLAVDQPLELLEDHQLLFLIGWKPIVERADSTKQALPGPLSLVEGAKARDEGRDLLPAAHGQGEAAGDPVSEGRVELVHPSCEAIELRAGAGGCRRLVSSGSFVRYRQAPAAQAMNRIVATTKTRLGRFGSTRSNQPMAAGSGRTLIRPRRSSTVSAAGKTV